MRRWIHHRLESLCSLKGRVFIAIVLVAIVPIAVAIGWAMIVERTWEEGESPSATKSAVYEAWGNAEQDYDDLILVRFADMKEKLRPTEFAALSRRIALLMQRTGGAYETTSIRPQSIRPDDDVPDWGLQLSAAALKQLADVKYYWGMATVWYEDPVAAPGGDPSSRFETTGETVPVVAWRSSPQRIECIYASPSYGEAGWGIPSWWWASVIGVALSVVIGLAVVATLVVTRGVARPLRGMAEASEAVVSAGTAELPVPVTGPPELKRVAAAFNRMAAESARARASEQAFLLSVSHELKTPLTAIRGYTEALEDGALPSEEAAATIALEAARLQRLVQDLLDLARYQRSEFAVRDETVDLSEVAGEVANRYESVARDYGLALEVAAPQPAPVKGDRDRVVQVVGNLVENALRCTPRGGKVTVSAAGSELRVSDTGVGLAQDDLPRAFERFYLHQRWSSDRKVGTGLGLAIVKELVEKMGGDVGVESTPGEGTTFTVRFPAAH